MISNIDNSELKKLIDKEGDFDEWVDEETGYTCRIHRLKPYGWWNGYVKLPPGMKISDPYENGLEVHGGVTWYGKFPIEEWRDDDSTWIGFDCNHAWDYSPYSGYISTLEIVSIAPRNILRKNVRNLQDS